METRRKKEREEKKRNGGTQKGAKGDEKEKGGKKERKSHGKGSVCASVCPDNDWCSQLEFDSLAASATSARL